MSENPMEELSKNISKTLEDLEFYLEQDGRFSPRQIENLLKFSSLVLVKNQYLNLTAITDAKGFYTKHILDSLSLLPYFDDIIASNIGNTDENLRFLDVGSGAGFPGIPIKIMRPDIDVVLLDSLKKRVKFLNEVIEEISLTNIKSVHARAEDLAHESEYRERFDLVSARAVAKLPSLLELTLPFVKLSGKFLAMKSSADELGISRNALKILGGKHVALENLDLPDDSGSRTIIEIMKVSKTPKAYPRQAGTPTKSPLLGLFVL